MGAEQSKKKKGEQSEEPKKALEKTKTLPKEKKEKKEEGKLFQFKEEPKVKSSFVVPHISFRKHLKKNPKKRQREKTKMKRR